MDITPLKSANYIYFGLIFIALSLMHAYGIFLIDEGTNYQHAFYIVYAIGQCFLEVAFLFFISCYLAGCKSKIWHDLFMFFTLIIFVLQIVDFPFVRFIDLSIWNVLIFAIDESFENYIELLHASNLSLTSWSLLALVPLAIFFSIFFVFKLTDRLVKKNPWIPSYAFALASLCVISTGLIIFDYNGESWVTHIDQSRFLKVLPFKNALFTGNRPTLHLAGFLKKSPSEEEAMELLASIPSLPIAKKPNTFLFIIESLRHDYLTPEISPNLSKFRENNTAFDLGISSANVTMLSWFSLFHSRYPFYWGKSCKQGSVPLQILKEAGYQIHVYSSARLSFYEMDRNIFGTDKQLADTLNLFPHDGSIPAHASDALCLKKLHEAIQRNREEEGHLYLVFLDATHFDYSWPKKEHLQFSPVAEELNYLELMQSKDNLELVKNRYRNAIHYVDSLFGIFYKELMQTPNGREAVVIVTGDHGEEFYEEGNIFHASNLSSMQTQVPLYYRFGRQKVLPQSDFTSHVDIFPSILHYVFGDERFSTLFDGESIFRKREKPYAISGRYNAKRPPYEFSIHNGKEKMIARFANEGDIFESKSLKLISRKSVNNECLECDESELKIQFKDAFQNLFSMQQSQVDAKPHKVQCQRL